MKAVRVVMMQRLCMKAVRVVVMQRLCLKAYSTDLRQTYAAVCDL